MKKTPYTVTIRPGREAAQIDLATPSQYSREMLHTYIEVSIDLDHETIKPRTEYNSDAIKYSYRLQRNATDPLANWQSRENAIYYVTEAAINAAEAALMKEVKLINRDLKDARNHPAYKFMQPIAAATIRLYKADFYYHDTLMLNGLTHNINFLWMIRDCGTWLITNRSEWTAAIIDQERKERRHAIYHYNGTELRQIDRNQLENYYNRLPDYKPAPAATIPANIYA